MFYLLISYFILQLPFRAFMYRERGDEHSWCGTQVSRILFWGVPYSFDGWIFANLLGFHGIEALLFGFVSLLLGWGSAVINHSNWQGPGIYNNVIMGLVTTLMWAVMLSPFILCEPSLAFFVPIGLTGAIASYLGYNAAYSRTTLKFLGITFCVPVVNGEGSSWEELGIGGFPFGLGICLVGFKLLGVL